MKRIIKRLFGSGSNETQQAYDERSYWGKREDPNAKEGWEEQHLAMTVNYLREHTEGAKSVLEIGPGVGRTLDAHSSDRKITGFDISNMYRERVCARAAELGLDFTLDIAEEGVDAFPYTDQQFDVGVSSQVFLHQKPENIKHMMSEMIRVCQKVVVVTGGYRFKGAAHVFDHDYPALATELGCEMNHVRAWTPHILFVYQRRS